jgi:hypothetical protein
MLTHHARSDIPPPGRHPVTLAAAFDLRSILIENDSVGSDG